MKKLYIIPQTQVMASLPDLMKFTEPSTAAEMAPARQDFGGQIGGKVKAF